MGVRWDRKKDVVSFHLSTYFYADDAGVLFESRNTMTRMMKYIYKRFLRFGLLIHVGRDGNISKAEYMYKGYNNP